MCYKDGMTEEAEGFVLVPTPHGQVRVACGPLPSGRWVAFGVRSLDGPLTADMLRAVPLGWVNAALSNDRNRIIIEAGGEMVLPPASPPPDLHLVVPRSKPKPAEFFLSVANLYRQLGESGSPRPSAEIAEANGVPAATVRGWVREARNRGFLGPATKGAVG